MRRIETTNLLCLSIYIYIETQVGIATLLLCLIFALFPGYLFDDLVKRKRQQITGRGCQNSGGCAFHSSVQPVCSTHADAGR